MLNTVNIMGRFTDTPELRSTASGTKVTSFTLACGRDFKNADGDRETDFVDVVAWGGTAEHVCKFFSKGRTAVINGRLQTHNWTGNDGKKRKNMEVVALSVYFGDSKKAESNEYQGAQYEMENAFCQEDASNAELPF